MILKVKNGMIWNEDNKVIAVLTDAASENEERIISLGIEAVPIVEEFVRSYKPKTTLKEFTDLIEKYEI